jgi:hypothetical protein
LKETPAAGRGSACVFVLWPGFWLISHCALSRQEHPTLPRSAGVPELFQILRKAGIASIEYHPAARSGQRESRAYAP